MPAQADRFEEMAYEFSCGDWPKHDVAGLASLLRSVDRAATERAARVNCPYCRSAVTGYSSKPKRNESGFWWHLATGYPPRLCASQDIRATLDGKGEKGN